MKITFKAGCGPVNIGKFAVVYEPKRLEKEKNENIKFAIHSDTSYKYSNLSLSNLFSEVKGENATESTTTSDQSTEQQASVKKANKRKRTRKRGGKKNSPEEVASSKAANPASYPAEVTSKKSATVAKSSKVTTKVDGRVLSTTLPARDITKSRCKTFAEVSHLQLKKQKPVAQRQVHEREEPQKRTEVTVKVEVEEPPKISIRIEEKKKVSFNEPYETWAQVLASTIPKMVARPTSRYEERSKFEGRISPNAVKQSSVKKQVMSGTIPGTKVVATNTKELIDEQKIAAKTVGNVKRSESKDEAARKEKATAVLDVASIEIIRILKTIQENKDLDREQISTNKFLCAASDELKRLMNHGMEIVEFVDVAQSNKGMKPREAQATLASLTMQPEEQISEVSQVALPVASRVSQVPAQIQVKEIPKLWSQILTPMKKQKKPTRVVPLVYKKLPIEEKIIRMETQKKDKILAQTMTKPFWKTATTPTTKTIVSPKSPKKVRSRGKHEPEVSNITEIDSDGF